MYCLPFYTPFVKHNPNNCDSPLLISGDIIPP